MKIIAFMSEWMIEWMDELNARMNEWINEWMNACMHAWMNNEWMNECKVANLSTQSNQSSKQAINQSSQNKIKKNEINKRTRRCATNWWKIICTNSTEKAMYSYTSNTNFMQVVPEMAPSPGSLDCFDFRTIVCWSCDKKLKRRAKGCAKNKRKP